MPGYATLAAMGAADFRAEVRRRRDAKRLSRDALAQLSGVSAALIEKMEMRDPPPKPRRTTVVDLARALEWDVDEALTLVDYPPLTDTERAELTRINSPRAQLDRLLDELPPQQLVGLLGLVRSMLGLPPPADEPDTEGGNPGDRRRVHVQTVEAGSGDILGGQPDRRENHPNSR